MAIEAKMSFLSQLEKRLETEVTVDSMPRVLIAVTDVLDGFEIKETFRADELAKDDLLDCYVSALKVMGRSQKTIDRYSYIIKRMMDYIKVPTRRITVYHLRSYLAYLQQRGCSEQTLEGERDIYTAYFKWLYNEGLIDKNPTANLGKIKVPIKKKKIYTEVELKRLDDNCENLRDRAIVAFLSATGCRISEVTELNRDQIDLDGLECVVHGKGNKERVVFFDSVTGMRLKDYLDSRTDSEKALFLNRYGERIQPGGVRNMLIKVGNKAGVDHVHPHRFRRTKATTLSRHGMACEQIMALLGHEKMDTTLQYIVQENEDIKYSYKRYS